MLPSETAQFALYSLALVLPLTFFFYHRRVKANTPPHTVPAEDKALSKKPLKSIMQAPKEDLAPPKDDPFTKEQLKQFDGTDPSKPIYVAIKGDVFDVSAKAEVYGAGRSYNIFAGKDASRGLGMSSLKPEDALDDYSTLDEKDKKVLEDWHAFFLKRYNIVGRVSDGYKPADN